MDLFFQPNIICSAAILLRFKTNVEQQNFLDSYITDHLSNR